MSDVKELIPGLDLIDIKRTSLVPAEEPERVGPEPAKKKRNKAIRGIEVAAAVSLGLNILQAIVIYILQAGPV